MPLLFLRQWRHLFFLDNGDALTGRTISCTGRMGRAVGPFKICGSAHFSKDSQSSGPKKKVSNVSRANPPPPSPKPPPRRCHHHCRRRRTRPLEVPPPADTAVLSAAMICASKLSSPAPSLPPKPSSTPRSLSYFQALTRRFLLPVRPLHSSLRRGAGGTGLVDQVGAALRAEAHPALHRGHHRFPRSRFRVMRPSMRLGPLR